MKKWTLMSIVLLMLASTSAFADVDFGGQVDWNKFNGARSGDWGVGARLEAGSSVRLITAFDYYFVNADILSDNPPPNNFNLKFYELSFDLAYYFPTYPARPYLGAGVSISKRTFQNVTLQNFFDDNKTQAGINALGGIKFNAGGAVKPFIEIRGVFYTGDESFNNRFVVSGGVVF